MHSDPIEQCAYCPRLCHDVCPTVRGEHRETPSPTSLMTFLMLERETQLPDGFDLAAAVEHCISCGRCESACLHSARPYDVFREARIRLATGPTPDVNWKKLPFTSAGSGNSRWLLLASLAGLSSRTVRSRLNSDDERIWYLPSRGLPQNLGGIWDSGNQRAIGTLVDAVYEDLATGEYAGIAWADYNERRAVLGLIEKMDWHGGTGYAPQILGLVPSESHPCGQLSLTWGCCGAGGNYPNVEPDAASELAVRCQIPESVSLPGTCVAHLKQNGRSGFATDWDIT